MTLVKNYHYISLVVDEKQKDFVMGACYSFDMLGCVEEKWKDGVLLMCYFQEGAIADQAKEYLKKEIPTVQIEISKIENQDWNENWRRKIKPVKVTENIWASPKWLKPKLHKGDYWIKIEPKMAFGTGHHETTRLAAIAILSIHIPEKTSSKLLDIGTGSGVLCFAGDYAGYGTAVGVENDPYCLASLVENNLVNNRTGSISFVIGTVEGLKNGAVFDTIVMNMIRTDSEPLLEKCRALLIPDGTFIWSGLLYEEKDLVIDNATKKGWLLVNELAENEWWCGVFKKN